jgi:hypothetical protein
MTVLLLMTVGAPHSRVVVITTPHPQLNPPTRGNLTPPHNSTMLIGISGKKRSGKDTVGAMVVEWLNEHGFDAAQVAFADQLKDEVAEATGVNRRMQEMDKERWRPILQWWGVEFRRHYFGQDYWVSKMTQKLLAMDEDLAVVTDVRFRDEADFIRDSGGFVVRVERETGFQDGHSSETDLDGYSGFQTTLSNDGTLDDLEEKVYRFMSQMHERERVAI